MARLSIIKAHGCHNDLFLVDASPASLGVAARRLPSFVRALCDRNGIFGADGIYFIDRSSRPADAEYFNSDGSPSEYCGNGLRCVGRFLLELEAAAETEVTSRGVLFNVSSRPAADGVHNIEIRASLPVMFGTIDSVISELDANLRFTIAAAPNPHLIAIVDTYDETRLERIGKAADRLPAFPNGVNTSFAMCKPSGDRGVFVRTYERRIGFTASCASGAVAAAATLVQLKLARASHMIRIWTLGGSLAVTIDRRADGLYPTQSGNATYVYRVEVDPREVLARCPQ